MPEAIILGVWIEDLGLQICMSILFLSFVVVGARSVISTLQLVLAAIAFRTRIKPTARGEDLWERYSDLALPVAVIAPCHNEERTVVDSVQALLGLHYPSDVLTGGVLGYTVSQLVINFLPFGA